MDRKLLKTPFTRRQIPNWQCPTCQKAALQLMKNSFAFEETALSKKARGHEAWEPDWITYVYSLQLQCPNSLCKETVMSVGEGKMDWDGYHNQERYTGEPCAEVFTPLFFYPNLKMFNIPEDSPKEVRNELNQSFSLFFNNPASAANHVRIALENVLTNIKIKRYEIVKKKRHFINLHKRIEMLPSSHKSVKELCFAVKWLGNAGSHSAVELGLDDVLDGYEIMEEVLKNVYSLKNRSALSLAKRINKKRGPSKKRK